MKILVTGVVAAHVGRVLLRYVQTPVLVAEALAAAGHQVERRPVLIGDDLGRYDRVLVFLQTPRALDARYVFGALRALAERPDALLAVDDWQLHTLHPGYRSWAKHGERILRTRAARANLYERAALCALSPARLRRWLAAGEELAGEWPRPVLVPAFTWHDPAKLRLRARRLVPVDPSGFYAATLPRQAAQVRERRWVLAALADNSAWVAGLGLTWPVTAYGGPRFKGGERVHEEVVIGAYARVGGVLSPPHVNVGSGWWRARVPQAVLAARAPLVQDARDPWPGALFTAAEVEAGDPAKLAAAQRRAVAPRLWPTERFTEAVDTFIRRGK